MPDFDIESGIIGAHTERNDVNGFCNLARVQAGPRLFWRWFGASLGLGARHHSIGALQPVGICHLMSCPACADGDPQNLGRAEPNLWASMAA